MGDIHTLVPENQSETRKLLLNLCFEAAYYVPVLDRADAAQFADWFVESTILTLRKRPQLPKLSRDDWYLIFADLRERAEARLADLIDGAAPVEDYAREVVRVLIERGAVS